MNKNLQSILITLNGISEKLQKEYRVDNLTFDEFEILMKKLEKRTKQGVHCSLRDLSKACLTGWRDDGPFFLHLIDVTITVNMVLLFVRSRVPCAQNLLPKLQTLNSKPWRGVEEVGLRVILLDVDSAVTYPHRGMMRRGLCSTHRDARQLSAPPTVVIGAWVWFGCDLERVDFEHADTDERWLSAAEWTSIDCMRLMSCSEQWQHWWVVVTFRVEWRRDAYTL